MSHGYKRDMVTTMTWLPVTWLQTGHGYPLHGYRRGHGYRQDMVTRDMVTDRTCLPVTWLQT